MASKSTMILLFASSLVCSGVRQVIEEAQALQDELEAELAEEAEDKGKHCTVEKANCCKRDCGKFGLGNFPDTKEKWQKFEEEICVTAICAGCRGKITQKKGYTKGPCCQKETQGECEEPAKPVNKSPDVPQDIDKVVKGNIGEDEEEEMIDEIPDVKPVVNEPKDVVTDGCTKGDTFCKSLKNSDEGSYCKKYQDGPLGRLCTGTDVRCSCEDDSFNAEKGFMANKGKCKRHCGGFAHGGFSGSMEENQATLDAECKKDPKDCGGCRGKKSNGKGRGSMVVPCCSGPCLRKALEGSGEDTEEDITQGDTGIENNAQCPEHPARGPSGDCVDGGSEEMQVVDESCCEDLDEDEEQQMPLDTKIENIPDERGSKTDILDEEENIVTTVKDNGLPDPKEELKDNVCSGIGDLQRAFDKAASGSRQLKRSYSKDQAAKDGNALQDELDAFALKAKASKCDVSESKWGKCKTRKKCYKDDEKGYTKADALVKELTGCCKDEFPEAYKVFGTW